MPPSRLIRFPRRDMLRLIAALPVVGIAGVDRALARQAPPARLVNASTAELVAGNTAFALDLYAALRDSIDGNLAFSPYSVSQALAMVYAGALGETAAQMQEVLSCRLDEPALHPAFRELTADLTMGDGPDVAEDAPALHIANALWGEHTYPFRAGFGAILDRWYGAGLQLADFVNAPEAAREAINAWVAEQTEGRIETIAPEGAITPATRLVLANAIHFAGRWFEEFMPAEPRDAAFHRLDGTTVTVPFMVRQSFFAYARGDGYQAVQIPYLVDVSAPASRFAFTVLVPDEGRYAAFEGGLGADVLDTAIDRLDSSTEVRLSLPPFAFELGVDLVPLLQAMGMVDAFDPERADLTGMTNPSHPAIGPAAQPLFLDLVLHKAFIHVDEEGTEAAAATYVGARPTAGMPTEPVEVRIDRPFLFAIRDTVTGTILFLGRVLDPRAEDLGLWRRVKGSAT